jgi:hypothetical protein
LAQLRRQRSASIQTSALLHRVTFRQPPISLFLRLYRPHVILLLSFLLLPLALHPREIIMCSIHAFHAQAHPQLSRFFTEFL